MGKELRSVTLYSTACHWWLLASECFHTHNLPHSQNSAAGSAPTSPRPERRLCTQWLKQAAGGMGKSMVVTLGLFIKASNCLVNRKGQRPRMTSSLSLWSCKFLSNSWSLNKPFQQPATDQTGSSFSSISAHAFAGGGTRWVKSLQFSLSCTNDTSSYPCRRKVKLGSKSKRAMLGLSAGA